LWFLKFMYKQNITNILANKWEIEFQCSFRPHHIQDVPIWNSFRRDRLSWLNVLQSHEAHVRVATVLLFLPSLHSISWALASLSRCHHSSVSSAHFLHPPIPRIFDVFLRATSSHLVLGFPTGLVLWNYPLRTFIGIHSSSILIIWPFHLSLLILILQTIFRPLYKL
jgi:hypothetical protein